ncbi:hypothetical protein PHYBLDRAFT_166593 [Phycomyces blakesleeanus NRRL 1555(-)]|uniref:No apical meristem-associated C-terminal domain-containing protein n=1 Tax=Phycomyces blakesleeanus (strain ATCC 8743b / DSM 1359 / FGSC 10004 / NBRC 33097 / NRRL 1555) TaxID=763407 RepID=A0A167N8P7_PHYB8|nr:hypothetical protein PHYBLDRAFT_166593 [Phycomyces blakesleeanus NRRL 1555(-)]OAD75340.1 hypothetical protein PHYBLDRAFT_166593 [Phycomyces blakesleeanus NRRL 1555(-)]|eukprot:XP_018293380.1 hypothetical protein PHYBLDRAFT_166593 [Phycomyces blakesleeanus NRRL 1555(-)]
MDMILETKLLYKTQNNNETFNLDHCYAVLAKAPKWISRLEGSSRIQKATNEQLLAARAGQSSEEEDGRLICRAQSNTINQRKRTIEDALFDLIDNQKRSRVSDNMKAKFLQDMLDFKYMTVDTETITDPTRRRFFLLKQGLALRRAEKDAEETEDEDDL